MITPPRTDAASPDDANPLPAPGFITDEMELTVTLTTDGQFWGAERVAERERILVPCTLESGVARQNPVSPHPLFDSVKYLGTDSQMKVLSEWCDFGAPEPVRAVRTYLLGGTLKDDLERALTPKKAKWKEGDGVRFCVVGAQPAELWRNSAVLDSWRDFFGKHCLAVAEEALCYTLGQTLPTAKKHPTAFSTLMLISMNGSNCQGRFTSSASNAVSVSAAATLKAHNALKWLIRRQGRYLDQSTVLLTWGTGAEKLPDLTDFDPEDEFASMPEKAARQVRTLARQAEAVADGSQGYESRLLTELAEQAREKKERGERSDAVVMVLDSTSGNGRASIAYYQELDITDYLNNLLFWYGSCKWPLCRWRAGQADEKSRTPLPREVAGLIYGERNGESDKKLKRQLTKRLIPCITERYLIPPDIAEAAFRPRGQSTGFPQGKRVVG